MRFADITGGLVKTLTGLDLSQGIVPALLGRNNIIGGLGGQTGVEIDSSGMIRIPGMSPFPKAEPEPKNILMGYPQHTYDDYPRHTYADFDGNYNYTGPLPGGPITKAEIEQMNRDYPIPISENISFGVAQS